MWRLLIYELEAKKLGLMKWDVAEMQLTIFPCIIDGYTFVSPIFYYIIFLAFHSIYIHLYAIHIYTFEDNINGT